MLWDGARRRVLTPDNEVVINEINTLPGLPSQHVPETVAGRRDKLCGTDHPA
ncbi:hypothetical protein ACVXG7_00235 [Enterobacter hormaechei]